MAEESFEEQDEANLATANYLNLSSAVDVQHGITDMNVEINTLSSLSAVHKSQNLPNESAVAIKIYDEQ